MDPTRRRWLTQAALLASAPLGACDGDEARASRRRQRPGRPSAPSLQPTGATPARTDREADVIVVGAGIAGLRAAEVIRAAGHRVIVLEARDRLGGRIWTDRRWPDLPLDMGASWIQGLRGNPIAAQARAAGIATVTTDGEVELHDPSGEDVTEHADAIERTLQRVLAAGRESTPDRDEPLRAALDRGLRAEALDADERLALEFAVSSAIEHEYAADASELSAGMIRHPTPHSAEPLPAPPGDGSRNRCSVYSRCTPRSVAGVTESNAPTQALSRADVALDEPTGSSTAAPLLSRPTGPLSWCRPSGGRAPRRPPPPADPGA